ncbi:hypothetical protein BM1_10319 [Bipolaris maydis]|nr:hypothetical protein BM1_10319 [Bipolaris maydis]
MARTVNRIWPNRSTTDKRPPPIPGTVPGFSADLGMVTALQLDDDSWALHIISALSFIHEHDIIFGDLSLEDCWLSSDSHLSLSLVGFLSAGFRRRTNGVWYHCTRTSGELFHPLEHQSQQSMQTDLFLFGCVMYELMTGFWPGEHTGKSEQEVAMMIPRKEWPPLEVECIGEIVRKC